MKERVTVSIKVSNAWLTTVTVLVVMSEAVVAVEALECMAGYKRISQGRCKRNQIMYFVLRKICAHSVQAVVIITWRTFVVFDLFTVTSVISSAASNWTLHWSFLSVLLMCRDMMIQKLCAWTVAYFYMIPSFLIFNRFVSIQIFQIIHTRETREWSCGKSNITSLFQ